MFQVLNHIKRNAGGTADAGGNDGTPPPADQKPPEGDGLESLPESWQLKIKDLRKDAEQNRLRRKELEDKQASDEAQRQKDEQTKLAEDGKWKELAEQREKENLTLKEKAALADTLLKGIQDSNAARIAKLPDAAKKLVPEGLDPIKLGAWLDTAATVLAQPPAPDLDGGRTGDGKKPEAKASEHYTNHSF